MRKPIPGTKPLACRGSSVAHYFISTELIGLLMMLLAYSREGRRGVLEGIWEHCSVDLWPAFAVCWFSFVWKHHLCISVSSV